MVTVYRFVAAALLVVAGYSIAASQPAASQPVDARDPDRPWIMPADAEEALRDPDRFAWRIFRALNWPADVERRAADPAATFGQPGPVVWETWAITSEVYLAEGRRPPQWENLALGLERESDGDEMPLQQALLKRTEPVPPGSTGHQTDEVRMNRATFDFIRDNGLYSVEGQERWFYSGRQLTFPVDSMEVKAVWRPISESERDIYHWATVTDADSGERHLYGLTALHVTSKVLPNWFWATFEHRDNPFRDGIHDEGWLIPSRDSVACPEAPHDCNRAPDGFGLEGTVWENYRLRGTQVDFTDKYGRPVLLANSELETGFQRSASCMTCHGRATIGPRVNRAASFEFGAGFSDHPLSAPQVNRIPVFKQNSDGSFEGYVGAPQPEWYRLPDTGVSTWGRYLHLDFVWSLMRAQNESRADLSIGGDASD